MQARGIGTGRYGGAKQVKRDVQTYVDLGRRR